MLNSEYDCGVVALIDWLMVRVRTMLTANGVELLLSFLA